MTVIELLAKELDREVLPHELGSPQAMFNSYIDYWNLCLKCKQVVDANKKRQI